MASLLRLRPGLAQCVRHVRAPCTVATRSYATAGQPSAFGRPSPASVDSGGSSGGGKRDNSGMAMIAAGLVLGAGFLYLMTNPKSAHERAKALPETAVSHSRIEAGDNHQVLRNEREHK
ncbi:unnamed protein product [Clonostachys rhizophaga]|uniref:Uncharacterized protein n=1 Tax=Clonostachys rhizophaga TaxID=160324 RepID=A0A9N9VB96_9HYPO|nr:unnamed protein product [Clonostachys rhizophaga]